MEPKYILTYFPAKALGEPIRLLLSYGNIEFEDKRITNIEWENYKKETPMGQVPTLQIDDKVVYDSVAISRYLGKKFGLAGKDDWEAMEIDMAISPLYDLRMRIAAVFFSKDENFKENDYNALNAEILPNYLKKLDEMAEKNNGHLALGKLTWADFYLAGIGDYMSFISKLDIFEKYSNLKAVVDNVKALPAIKAWYEKAPESAF